MTTYEEELKEHINVLKQQLNHKGEVVWDKQVGGSHYKNFEIQPAEFVSGSLPKGQQLLRVQAAYE